MAFNMEAQGHCLCGASDEELHSALCPWACYARDPKTVNKWVEDYNKLYDERYPKITSDIKKK